MNFPFKERLISEGVVERTFSSGTDSDELIWHRDREDRHLLVVESGGWQFQMDNGLPVNLEPGQELLVPAGAWHRVIRGNNDLKIIINKGQQSVTEEFKMKLTKAALKQIIKEELTEILGGRGARGYTDLGGGKLRWDGSKTREKFPSAALAKKFFLDKVREDEKPLSRQKRTEAMMWIDRNWEKMTTREKAIEQIQDWIEDNLT